MKTVSVAILYCLNIGVDPPDVIKIEPCARLECWIGISFFSKKSYWGTHFFFFCFSDPFSDSPQKSLERIGKALQAQYERWQPRVCDFFFAFYYLFC